MPTVSEASATVGQLPAGLRPAHKHRTREQIRASAIDLFEERGYEHATIEEIAQSAGVGRRTFFRYFPCKEAVLFSDGVFQHLGADLAQTLSDGLAPVAALLAAMARDGYGTDALDDMTIRRRRLRVALLGEPGVAAYYNRSIDAAAASVTATIRQHPLYDGTPHLPELVGGLLRTMTLEHLHSGNTHHFAVDVASWRAGVRALEGSFPA